MGLTFLTTIAMSKYDSCLYLHNDKVITDWGDMFGKMKPGSHTVAICPVLEHHRITQRVEDAGFEIRDCILFLGTPELMVTLARVPLEGTVAGNVLKYGTGALNIDKCRVEINPDFDDPRLGGAGSWSTDKMALNTYGDYAGERTGSSPLGRWPANCVLSGGVNVVKMFPSSKGSPLEWQSTGARNGIAMNCSEDGSMRKAATYQGYGDDGSAARYFYNITEDNKLQGLVAYLHKLITPVGGTTLFIPNDLL